jgi:amidohydrolase
MRKFIVWIVILAISSNQICKAQFTKTEMDEATAMAVDVYHAIHEQPELGKKEFKTSALIKTKLQFLGFTNFYKFDILPTAIIVILDTKRPGKTIGLRAELDARKDHELTNLPYKSKIDSVMHSCGHDAHAAILLASASLIIKHLDLYSGKIVFIFQPAEEIKGGADDIVNAGILELLGIKELFALHAASGLKVGAISVCPGFIMAGSNSFKLNISGRSSHAAAPYDGDDIPFALSDIVRQLENIPARKLSISDRPCIISTTFISSGSAESLNVLPASGEIRGTIRSYENIDSPFINYPSIDSVIKETVNRYCSSRKIQCTLKIEKGSPPCYNDSSLFSEMIPGLKGRFSGVIDTTPFKGMFSEDFAYYTERVRCVYFGWGIAKGDLGNVGVHSSHFTIHPDAFKYGIELMTLIPSVSSQATSK